MKLKQVLMAVALAMSMVALTACSGCAGLPKESDKIALACDTASSGLEAVTVAYVAKEVPRQALVDALAIHKSTDKWCKPVATKLSPTDYAELLAAGARIAAKKKETPR